MIDKPLKRNPKSPPPPAGGISMRAAAHKFNVSHTTVLKWVRKGIIPVLKRTSKCTYIDENAMIDISKYNPTERHRLVESFNNNHK